LKRVIPMILSDIERSQIFQADLLNNTRTFDLLLPNSAE